MHFVPNSGQNFFHATLDSLCMNAESIENAASISEAAKQLGVDAFSLYGLIQREIVRPQRKRRGELVVLQVELDRVLKGPAPSDNETETR